jgi:hypothetical protein
VDKHGGGAVAAEVRGGRKGREGEGQSELRIPLVLQLAQSLNSLACVHAAPGAPQCRRISTVVHGATRKLLKCGSCMCCVAQSEACMTAEEKEASRRQLFNPKEAFQMLSKELMDIMHGAEPWLEADAMGDDVYKW